MFDLSGEALEAAQVKEKLMNNVMWDKATVDKLVKEIPKAKLITPATVSERLKVTFITIQALVNKFSLPTLAMFLRRVRNHCIFPKKFDSHRGKCHYASLFYRFCVKANG